MSVVELDLPPVDANEADISAPRKLVASYIIADPEICGGQPTFRGTRIMVWQVLSMIAAGMDWEAISQEWRGKVSPEAIAEAVQLARRVFVEQAPSYEWESAPA